MTSLGACVRDGCEGLGEQRCCPPHLLGSSCPGPPLLRGGGQHRLAAVSLPMGKDLGTGGVSQLSPSSTAPCAPPEEGGGAIIPHLFNDEGTLLGPRTQACRLRRDRAAPPGRGPAPWKQFRGDSGGHGGAVAGPSRGLRGESPQPGDGGRACGAAAGSGGGGRRPCRTRGPLSRGGFGTAVPPARLLQGGERRREPWWRGEARVAPGRPRGQGDGGGGAAGEAAGPGRAPQTGRVGAPGSPPPPSAGTLRRAGGGAGPALPSRRTASPSLSSPPSSSWQRPTSMPESPVRRRCR